MDHNPSNRPIGLHQAARTLGLPPDWLRAEADSGRIPALRAGDRLYFDLDLLRQLLLQRARGEAKPEGGAS